MTSCDCCNEIIDEVCFCEMVNGKLYYYHPECYKKLVELMKQRYGNPHQPEPNA